MSAPHRRRRRRGGRRRRGVPNPPAAALNSISEPESSGPAEDDEVSPKHEGHDRMEGEIFGVNNEYDGVIREKPGNDQIQLDLSREETEGDDGYCGIDSEKHHVVEEQDDIVCEETLVNGK